MFQVFVSLLSLLVFLFSAGCRSDGQSVSVVTAAGWRGILEAQRATDGRRQDDAQDDAADDDHDLLLQGDETQEGRKEEFYN